MHEDTDRRRRPGGHRRGAPASDADLVAAIARGDHDALGSVFEREGGSILAVARGICGPERADDVLQDVLVALWRRPDRFDPARGTLRSYVLLQARSRATDLIRSDSARSARERSVATNGSRHPGARSREVEDLVLARLAGEAAQAALRSLPDDEREAIAMAYFGGLTYRQVAAVLDRPEGTVKSQIRAGLTRMRSDLASRGA